MLQSRTCAAPAIGAGSTTTIAAYRRSLRREPAAVRVRTRPTLSPPLGRGRLRHHANARPLGDG